MCKCPNVASTRIRNGNVEKSTNTYRSKSTSSTDAGGGKKYKSQLPSSNVPNYAIRTIVRETRREENRMGQVAKRQIQDRYHKKITKRKVQTSRFLFYLKLHRIRTYVDVHMHYVYTLYVYVRSS